MVIGKARWYDISWQRHLFDVIHIPSLRITNQSLGNRTTSLFYLSLSLDYITLWMEVGTCPDSEKKVIMFMSKWSNGFISLQLLSERLRFCRFVRNKVNRHRLNQPTPTPWLQKWNNEVNSLCHVTSVSGLRSNSLVRACPGKRSGLVSLNSSPKT